MDYEGARKFSRESANGSLERWEFFSELQPGVWVADGVKQPSSITVRGESSLVLIGSGADCTGASLTVNGDDCLAVVGAHATLRRGRVQVGGTGSVFWLGALTTTAELVATVASGSSVSIGDEGMGGVIAS